MKLVAFIILLLSVNAQPDFDNFYVTRKQLLFEQHELTAAELIEYGSLSDVVHLQSTAERLAVPRVVGSKNHREVREFIVNNLQDLDWSVEVQTFEAQTPIFGKLQFHNVIAKLNPNAEHYLMLACHYDSKYFPDIEFVGATDSAVPCAMLLNLAHVLAQPLQNMRQQKLSLMLVFFDGEEAFLQWNDKDSIYGAKHMAKTWHESGFLDKIDMLMLLDLIGMPDPKFYSFFSNTEIWYARLLDIEDRLNDSGYLAKYASSGMVQHNNNNNNNRYFQEQHMRSSYIEDDHVPFLRRGVPIIHLISTPFPDVWHTIGDNLTVIDFVTTENIARIVRLFAIEYLHGAIH